MNNLSTYIIEKLRITKDIKKMYNYHPKDKYELISLLKKLLEERGKNADLNDIDVSNITDMSNLFEDLDFNIINNINISEWDVSNVTNMESMFNGCIKFNSDLSNWDISNVKNMGYMFYYCKNFNADLSKWDVSNVKNMEYMFFECNSLKNKPSWYDE